MEQPQLSRDLAHSRYADVNGRHMYYEVHGSGQPLVLLRGGLSATETSFGLILPALAKNRQVISIEQQAHGRTADIDRPLTFEQMAKDTVALLQQIGIDNADFLGYSVGAGIALEIAIRHTEMVRKLVVVSMTYNPDGFQPGLLAGMEALKPEQMVGSPFAEEYARIAPNPQDWPALIEKVKRLDMEFLEAPMPAGK